jgi:hypothetical protein
MLICVLAFLLMGYIEKSNVDECKHRKKRRNQIEIIVQNYNREGGFFWQMYQVLNAMFMSTMILKESTQTSVFITVRFQGGYYAKDENSNWFEDFFEPINAMAISENEHERLLDDRKRIYFNRRMLIDVMEQHPHRHKKFKNLWKKHIKPRSKIMNEVNAFAEKCGFHVPGTFLLTMHVRLTDKMKHSGGSEDYNVHLSSEFCIKVIQKHVLTVKRKFNKMHKMKSQNVRRIILFVCSDEQPFVDEILQSNIQGVTLICARNIARSKSNSFKMKHVNVDTSKCQIDDSNPISDECKYFQMQKENSLHKGNKHIPPFQKGLDAMVDMLLLSKGDMLFRTRGNFSNFAEYLLRDEAHCIDLIEEHAQQKTEKKLQQN